MHNLQADASKLRYRRQDQGSLEFRTLKPIDTLTIVGILVVGKQTNDQFFSGCGLYKGKDYTISPKKVLVSLLTTITSLSSKSSGDHDKHKQTRELPFARQFFRVFPCS